MNKKITLLIDAIINLFLGILLLAFSPVLVSFLGVPATDNNFYPNILGSILFGIGIALLIEAYRKNENEAAGLGLLGAISINLCGGIVLFLWLVFGNLNLPIIGQIFLWILDVILVLISSLELFLNLKSKKENV